MVSSLSVLYVGSLDEKSNSYRRYKALCSIAGSVDAIDTEPYIMAKYIAGFQHYLNIGPGIFLLNRKVKKYLAEKEYDILLADNKSYLSIKTLLYAKRKQPAIKTVNLLTDDPFGKFAISWRLIKKTAAYYDLFFVQREININELKTIGAKKVLLCYRSFDPLYNKPLVLDKEDEKIYRTKVGFTGTYEDVRASFIAYLIKNGIEVSVTGNDWENALYWNIVKPYYKGPSIYGDNYIKSLNGMDIALHFLRHANRDEQDSRTFEIPACKVFMVAERSALHMKLFKENEEAVFFSTKEELLEKIKHYMDLKEERMRIAKNGYERCINDGYDHRSRMTEVLKAIVEEV